MKFAAALLVLLSVALQATASCPSGYFNCDSGGFIDECVPDSDRCDNYNDCSNGADEDDCTTINVGLAVGLAIAGFVLFIVAPIVIVVIIICCCVGVCAGIASSGGRRTRVVTQTVPSAAPQTTVVSTSNMQQANMYQPAPPMAQPPPYNVQPGQYQPVPYKMQ